MDMTKKFQLVNKFTITTEQVPSKVVLFQTGFYVPAMGTPTDMTKEGLELIIKNFNDEVIPRPSAYYGHFDIVGGRKAAGEINSIYLEYNEDKQKYILWGDIEWTPAAIKALKDKEYKFLSSEIHPNYCLLYTSPSPRDS